MPSLTEMLWEDELDEQDANLEADVVGVPTSDPYRRPSSRLRRCDTDVLTPAPARRKFAPWWRVAYVLPGREKRVSTFATREEAESHYRGICGTLRRLRGVGWAQLGESGFVLQRFDKEAP
jgi:hypothetical protein